MLIRLVGQGETVEETRHIAYIYNRIKSFNLNNFQSLGLSLIEPQNLAHEMRVAPHLHALVWENLYSV